MISLRPDQQAAVDECRRRVGLGQRRIIAVAPTGWGKTIFAAEMCRLALGKGRRALFICPQREQVKQAHARFNDCGVRHSIFMAGMPHDPEEAVQIASAASVRSWTESGRADLPPADIVLVDECHLLHYLDILRLYPDAVAVGLTATPTTDCGRGLPEWHTLFIAQTYAEAIRQGTLVPMRVICPDLPQGVSPPKGERFSERKIVKFLKSLSLVGHVVNTYCKHAIGRRAVVFAVDVAHARALAKQFNAAGVPAAAVCGSTPDRERSEIFGKFTAGELQVICNYGVCSTGWDSPPCEVAILARVCLQSGPYVQLANRATRAAPGKTDSLFIDHFGTSIGFGHPQADRRWPQPGAGGNADADALADFGPPDGLPPPSAVCPRCETLWGNQGSCPGCGYEPQKRHQNYEFLPGDLFPLQELRERYGLAAPAKPSPSKSQSAWNKWLSIGRNKDWTFRQAAAAYRRETGDCPYRNRDLRGRPCNDHEWDVHIRKLHRAKA